MQPPRRSRLRFVKSRVDRGVRSVTKILPRWPVPALDASVVALCVYRSRNSGHVAQMIAQLPESAELRLHALDRVPMELADRTLSSGPGERTPLLQSLIEAQPLPDDAWVVIFDDDAEFARPGRTPFLDIAAASGFDISGPAIDVGQHRTYTFTLVGRLSIARTVKMVEVGPVVAFSPKGFAGVSPLPADAGMGWGLDVRWSQLPDLRRGYVDATPIRHFGAVAAGYAKEPEMARLQRELSRSGITSMSELSGTVQTWRPWAPQPPWRSKHPGAVL